LAVTLLMMMMMMAFFSPLALRFLPQRFFHDIFGGS